MTAEIAFKRMTADPKFLQLVKARLEIKDFIKLSKACDKIDEYNSELNDLFFVLTIEEYKKLMKMIVAN